MITKNINNGNLSSSYNTAVETAPRQWQVKIYKKSGSSWLEVSCAIKKMTITKGSCGTSTSFSVGNIISSMVTAELLELSTPIKGYDIRVDVGLYTNAWEWITVGQFTAIDVVKTVYSTSLTGYGYSTTKMGDAYTPSVLTITGIASEIQSATGVPIIFDTGIVNTYAFEKELPANTTYYSALQLIARSVGGYVVDNPNGSISFKRYTSATTASISASRMVKLPELSEADFTVTGVYVLVKEATEVWDEETEQEVPVPEVSYTYGTPVVLKDTNEYMTADIFNNFKSVVGYTYRDGTVNIALGDPRIEGTDVLSVTDVEGNVYIVPCHKVTHTYDGGLSTTVTAVMPTNESVGLSTGTPINQVVGSIATSAELARVNAQSAIESAEIAQTSAQQAQGLALQASTDAQIANNMAFDASQSAQSARTDAGNASAYANSALSQLGVVEDIVGVMDFITKNGTYELTQDSSPQNGKWYFTRSGSGTEQDPYLYEVVTDIQYDYYLTEDTTVDPNKTYYTRSGTSPNYTYTEVDNPVDSGLSTYYEFTNSPKLHGYYEITGVENAIKNYLSSRLVVTGQGLWIQDPSMQTKILLSSTEGIELYGADGEPVAKYGETAMIGRQDGFHIEIDGQELGFYQTANVKVAYVRNNQLFIPQSVVLDQMDIGLPFGSVNPSTGETAYGQWSWKLHLNAESPKRNNLTLRWIG